MSPLEVVTLGQNAVTITLLLAAPLLIVGMVVGLIVAIFQATTQIQEMTLTFVPKIVAVMLAQLFFASWMLIKITDYTRELFINIPNIIR
ncbi:MAG: flagellar biosynthesis protein FliQ [Desulfobulbaceae bacterium]|uniref:Flagellar biosynthetic protein FliQ n=1 Tax=Candidatus Desulfobia pelagia TaxID=2841692 RepID=A0A8J6NA70_9BACT|nr:flagellar biosynthesis protein FliQ [Candidatus Desulfobia pelagia]